MFELLYDYIQKLSSQTLTQEEKALIQEKFKLKKLRKRQYFLQEGEVCVYMGFIVKGSVRMFSVDGKGHEHVLRFGLENWWAGDYESYKMLTPSRYHVESLEETTFLIITNEHMQELSARIPAVDTTIRTMDQRSAIAAQKRMHDAISLTAEERYEELAKTYPVFLQRFPQSMIASYLGMSPETLSRLRKQALHR